MHGSLVRMFHGRRLRAVSRRGGRYWRWAVGSLTEIMSSYGVYIIYLGGAATLAGVLFVLVGGENLKSDLRVLISSVRDEYQLTGRYTDLDPEHMVKSGRLPDNFVVGKEIWIGGNDFNVRLTEGAAGSGNGQEVGAPNVRFYVLTIGSSLSPIRDVEQCVDLAMMNVPNMNGVQVLAAGTSLTRIATDPTSNTPSVGATWRDGGAGGSSVLLSERNPNDAQTVCLMATALSSGAQVSFGLN